MSLLATRLEIGLLQKLVIERCMAGVCWNGASNFRYFAFPLYLLYAYISEPSAYASKYSATATIDTRKDVASDLIMLPRHFCEIIYMIGCCLLTAGLTDFADSPASLSYLFFAKPVLCVMNKGPQAIVSIAR